ncbi:hypothetical protein PanWU01x14_231750 [Parasponia andersonii]|uniref:Uncharacterized protein n=1 Tax=Parasponia andersonii TaxID=3476 RepID=A0A2P5BK95_PARAD|nr:hypothetical protein PanWU01x14_231750 [Parasponia andersonii]
MVINNLLSFFHAIMFDWFLLAFLFLILLTSIVRIYLNKF